MDAFLNSCGMAYFLHMQWSNSGSFSAIGWPPALKISADIASEPGALSDDRSLIAFVVSVTAELIVLEWMTKGPPHDKTNKMTVRQAKTQISLGIQSLRCPHEESLGPYLPIERIANTLIRLGGCPSWSESALGAQSFCWFCREAAQMFYSFSRFKQQQCLRLIRLLSRPILVRIFWLAPKTWILRSSRCKITVSSLSYLSYLSAVCHIIYV